MGLHSCWRDAEALAGETVGRGRGPWAVPRQPPCNACSRLPDSRDTTSLRIVKSKLNVDRVDRSPSCIQRTPHTMVQYSQLFVEQILSCTTDGYFTVL